MQGPALRFAALWIGMASICCSQDKLKVVGFEYAEGPQTSPRITVQVYNWAHVQPETLAAAEDEAARIFKKASVEIVWMNCPLSVVEAGASPICWDSGPRGPLVVRIVYDAPRASRAHAWLSRQMKREFLPPFSTSAWISLQNIGSLHNPRFWVY